MKNVSLLCIMTLQGEEKGSLYADEWEKRIQTFKRYDIIPTNLL